MKHKSTIRLTREELASASAQDAEDHLLSTAEHDAWMRILPYLKRDNPAVVTPKEGGEVEVSVELLIPKWRTVYDPPKSIGLYLITGGGEIAIARWSPGWDVNSVSFWGTGKITHWTWLPNKPNSTNTLNQET